MIHRSLVTDSATAPPVTTWCPTARAASRAGPTVPGYAAWPWRSVWVKSGYQRRIHHLLNRGETRNSLARDVFHGHRGQLRKHYQVGQENQLDTLGIMINILVLWQTVYIQAALDHLATNGHHPDPALIARLPARAPHHQRPRPIQHHHPTTRRRTAPPPHQRLKPNPAGRSGAVQDPVPILVTGRLLRSGQSRRAAGRRGRRPRVRDRPPGGVFPPDCSTGEACDRG